MQTFLKTVVVVLLSVFFLGPQAQAACSRPGETSSSAKVYATPPTFSTGGGWKFGEQIATLPPGTSVCIVGEKEIGFFFDKKVWYQIEFTWQNRAQTGWVFSGNVRRLSASLQTRPVNIAGVMGFLQVISSAFQREGGEDGGQPSGLPSLTFVILYSLIFISILLGMIGYNFYAALDSDVPIASTFTLRNNLRTVIVAPMAFASFLTVGDYAFQGESGVAVSCLLAFQNGFFWQTVLPARNKRVRAKPPE